MKSIYSNRRRVNRWLSNARRVLIDTVWPPVCHGCGGAAELRPDELCDRCMGEIERPMQQAYCARCGRSVAPFELTPHGCGECRAKGRGFAGAFRVAAYRDGFAKLFRRYKFHGYENLELFFARKIAREILQSDHYEDIDVLVPVPTCWQHRLRRSFHPAGGLARRLSKHTSIPCAPLLDRIKGGPSQVGLSGTARLNNVRGKFAIARGCSASGGRVCLVDDIMTTGATARECARMLKGDGAVAVYVAFVARAGEDLASIQVA